MNVYKGIAIYDPARQSNNINDLEMRGLLIRTNLYGLCHLCFQFCAALRFGENEDGVTLNSWIDTLRGESQSPLATKRRLRLLPPYIVAVFRLTL